jgi:low affinity Fe/Cu permease
MARSRQRGGPSKASAAGGSHAIPLNGARKGRGGAPPKNNRPSWFTLFAQRTAQLAGRPGAFILATAIIVAWAISGPIFGYSDTWQLVINTGTTIVTFLMVFLIQHSQNRDATAFQVKLDELIVAMRGASNEIAGAEDLCDEDLEALHKTYRRRAAETQDMLERRRTHHKAG